MHKVVTIASVVKSINIVLQGKIKTALAILLRKVHQGSVKTIVTTEHKRL